MCVFTHNTCTHLYNTKIRIYTVCIHIHTVCVYYIAYYLRNMRRSRKVNERRPMIKAPLGKRARVHPPGANDTVRGAHRHRARAGGFARVNRTVATATDAIVCNSRALNVATCQRAGRVSR